MTPSRKLSSRPSTRPPRSASGLVLRIVPSARARSGQVKTSSVGRLGMCGWPESVSWRAAIQRAPPIRPTSSSVPGPAVAQRVEAPLGQLAGALDKVVSASPPGGHGIVGVEAQRMADRRPEPLDVRLAEHLGGPRLGRVGDDRPRHAAPVDRREPELVELGEACAAEPPRVEAVVERRVRGARDARHRGAGVKRVLEALDHPRGRRADRLVGADIDHRPTHPRIAVEDIHIAGARPVGLLGDRLGERRRADLAVDEQALPLGKRDAGLDHQPGVGPQSLVGYLNRPRRSG